MGVAVQSHWFSVGSIVTWAEAGVGAVATQSFIDPGYPGVDRPRAQSHSDLSRGVCERAGVGGIAGPLAGRRTLFQRSGTDRPDSCPRAEVVTFPVKP